MGSIDKKMKYNRKIINPCDKHSKMIMHRKNLKASNGSSLSWVRRCLKVVPDWIQEYVLWHREERKRSNDPSKKYLIVVGYRDMGILTSLPYFLLTAYKTK